MGYRFTFGFCVEDVRMSGLERRFALEIVAVLIYDIGALSDCKFIVS